MTNNLISIFLGIVCGISTSIIIWLSVKIFEKIVIPWYQKAIYRGIDISGNWEALMNNPKEIHAKQIIEINQKGNNLKGTLISINNYDSDKSDTAVYKLYGEIFDNYIDVEYQIADKKMIGRGSILMKVKKGGKKLEGKLVAIDRVTGEIMTSDKVEWIRKK